MNEKIDAASILPGTYFTTCFQINGLQYNRKSKTNNEEISKGR